MTLTAFISFTFIGYSIYLFSFKAFDPLKTLKPLQLQGNKSIDELQKENERLKGALESILPKDQKIIYENPYGRYDDYTPSYSTVPLQQVITKGNTLNFEIEYKNPGYLRPLYNAYWKNTYYRGWLDLPEKIKEARHKLFIYYGGLSNIYDFEGSLGFNEKVPFDYHININFLVYHFNVKNIKMFEHQIVLIGEPYRTGAQVIAVNVRDILPKDIDTKEFLFQLSTSQGYEIDYEYGSYARSEYLKKLEEKGLDKKAFSSEEDAIVLKLLKEENMHLKQELAKYLPLEEESITEERCRLDALYQITQPLLDIKGAREKGKKIIFKTHYQNIQYKRPIYDPMWKQNAEQQWSYMPTQVCENLHNVFIIPEDQGKKTDLLGRLSLHEKYQTVKNTEVGFLIYNLTVKEVILYNNQLIMMGELSRTGAEIISINKENLLAEKKYLVQLATPDSYELDYAIID